MSSTKTELPFVLINKRNFHIAQTAMRNDSFRTLTTMQSETQTSHFKLVKEKTLCWSVAHKLCCNGTEINHYHDQAPSSSKVITDDPFLPQNVKLLSSP
jgi:hypothetical protein